VTYFTEVEKYANPFLYTNVVLEKICRSNSIVIQLI